MRRSSWWIAGFVWMSALLGVGAWWYESRPTRPVNTLLHMGRLLEEEAAPRIPLDFMARLAEASNSHGVTDSTAELYAVLGDAIVPFLVTQACLPPVPGGGGSLTFGSFSCSVYAKNTSSGAQVYISQPAIGLGPLNAGDGTYWFAMHRDVSTSVASWTRQTGSHYLWQKTASQPANPNGGLVAAQITVSGGKITAIVPSATSSSTRNPSMGIMYAADYGVICDGATETSGRLQQAITLAAANNVSLQLPGGTCVIRTGMSVPTKSRIIGAPNGELYWDTPVAGVNVVLDLAEGGTQITIEGVRLRSTNTTAVVNATFNSNYPIRLNNNSFVVISHCYVQDSWGEAAILVGPGATATNHSDHNLLEGNQIVRASNYGIEISSGNTNIVRGNYLEDANLGLNNGGSGQVRSNVFANNIVRGVANLTLVFDVGGAVTGDNQNNITGNILTNARARALTNFLFGVFANNTIKGVTASSGNQVPGEFHGAVAATISGNFFDGTNYTGAFAVGVGNLWCEGCADSQIVGNTVVFAPNINGVGLSGTPARVNIAENIIVGNGANGLEILNAATDVVVKDNVVVDNNPSNNGGYGGITLNGTVGTHGIRTSIRHNKVFSPASDKQSVPLGLINDDQSFVEGNILYPRQAAQAFVISGSTNIFISNNKLAVASLYGSFTMPAAASATITNGNVTGGVVILLMPINASAATLMGSAKHLYISAATAFTSFAVTTGNGVAAAGTEAFVYHITGD